MARTADGDRRQNGAPEDGPRGPGRGDRPWESVRTAARLLYVRLRFVAVFAVAFVIVGQWGVLRNYWDVLTHGGGLDASRQAISPDTEYFCPMCPGVLSDWPAKCPVCNMALVRRKKGEMAPLPDGVLARMQLSPYRVQLAGLKTAPVEYRPLFHEVRLVGYLQGDPAEPSRLWLRCDVPARDAALLRPGQPAEVTADALAGHRPWAGRVRQVAPPGGPGPGPARVLIDLADPAGDLRPGLVVSARVSVAATQLDWFTRTLGELAQGQAAFDLAVRGVGNPAGHGGDGGGVALLRWAERQAAARAGLVLALPTEAVVDTGARKLVYVESGPGVFDGVEVSLGPRFGEHYAVVSGLSPGQRVATAGAFLIDAESRLNPSIAASYFGASGSPAGESGASGRSAAPPTAAEAAAVAQALAKLPAADRALAVRQKVCPVTGGLLGSMGPPHGVEINGRKVFLCCAGCEKELRRDAARYLSQLPAP